MPDVSVRQASGLAGLGAFLLGDIGVGVAMALYDLTSAELVAGDPAQKFPGLTELGMSADEQAEIIAALTSAGVYSPTNSDALASVRVKAELVRDETLGNSSDALIYTNLSGVSVFVENEGPGGGVIATSNGNDYLYSVGSDNVLIGGSGGDYLLVQEKARGDTLFGGEGNDGVNSHAVALAFDPKTNPADFNVLYGGSGVDVVYTDYSGSVLYGGAGNDRLYAASKVNQGKSAGDTLYGGDGDDELYGANSPTWHVINGVTVSGGAIIYGEAGNDTYYGQSYINQGYELNVARSDTVYGGEGNDILDAVAGVGLLYGDAGDDTIYSASQPIYASVGGGFVEGVLGGTVYGGEGKDYISVRGGAVSAYGGEGNDAIEIYGYNGSHFIYGGDGNDSIQSFSGWYGFSYGVGAHAAIQHGIGLPADNIVVAVAAIERVHRTERGILAADHVVGTGVAIEEVGANGDRHLIGVVSAVNGIRADRARNCIGSGIAAEKISIIVRWSVFF